MRDLIVGHMRGAGPTLASILGNLIAALHLRVSGREKVTMLAAPGLVSSLFGGATWGSSLAGLMTGDGSFTVATTAEPCEPGPDQ
jgi:hypothetical protein